MALSTDAVAQTSIRLFAQLREFGYTSADQAQVQQAYLFAMRLHAGAYRGSGKPLLAHTVGVASILAQMRAPASLVAAATAHAVYVHGEFGDGYRGITSQKRSEVVAGLGEEVESLVADYTQLEWSRSSAPQILATLHERNARDRQLLLLRLANELEDHLDLGILYCSDAPRRLRKIDGYLFLTIEMARRLDHEPLAEALHAAFEQCRIGQVPSSDTVARTTFHLAPRSHRLRPGLQFRNGLRAVMQRLSGWRR